VDSILQWFLDSPEYRQGGFNIPTFVFIGTAVVTIAQSWSVIVQNRSIWAMRSAEKVEPLMFAYLLFYCLSFAVYGYLKGSVIELLSGLSGILYVPVLMGVVKFRDDIRPWHIVAVTVIGCAMLAGMVMVEDKDTTLLIYLFVILAFMGKQAWTIWHSDDMGELSVEWVVVYIAAFVFWFCYGFITGSLPLKVFNSVALILALIMLKPKISRWKIFRR
jgi:uncharacterized protein with PQ loop repeat